MVLSNQYITFVYVPGSLVSTRVSIYHMSSNQIYYIIQTKSHFPRIKIKCGEYAGFSFVQMIERPTVARAVPKTALSLNL